MKGPIFGKLMSGKLLDFRRCEFCFYRFEKESDDDTYYCRRYPPLSYKPERISMFPIVPAGWYCGEFFIDPECLEMVWEALEK